MKRVDRSRVWLPGVRRLVLAPLLLVIWSAVGVSSAEAICVMVKAKEMRPKNWDVVFLGRTPVEHRVSRERVGFGSHAREIQFEVLASWKGVVPGDDSVAVQVGFGEIYPSYRNDGVYVVYARSSVSEEGVEMLFGPTCVEAFRWCERYEKLFTRALHRSLGRPEWWIGRDPEDRC